jgi:HPt (histidine-containing phosphotransfer) domain-containing protein
MSRIEDVINWDEAMVQAGDDEEFLRELLVDFREELLAQIAKINVALVSKRRSGIQSVIKAIDDEIPFHVLKKHSLSCVFYIKFREDPS